jgi:two-component system response regulator CpxR
LTEVNVADQDIVKNKRILAVDDEEDVLAVIREQLENVNLITAGDFDKASELIQTEPFDLVILDIMGVRGFDLLEIAARRKLPAVMLTAHALTPMSLQKAIDEKAVSFLPKDELSRLADLIAEIFQDLESGRTHWATLIDRLGPRFRQIWGETWDEIRFPHDSKISW